MFKALGQLAPERWRGGYSIPAGRITAAMIFSNNPQPDIQAVKEVFGIDVPRCPTGLVPNEPYGLNRLVDMVVSRYPGPPVTEGPAWFVEPLALPAPERRMAAPP